LTPFGVVGVGIAGAGLTRIRVAAATVRFMGVAACLPGRVVLAPDVTSYALIALEGYVARVIVDVMLKPEIHDPQGEAVLSASHRLGFGNVTGVRQGKRFELELDGPADGPALASLEELARELLANPVIEEFSMHITE
jgi:phosphoribosylformylglycinamidine synthase subunit PurS